MFLKGLLGNASISFGNIDIVLKEMFDQPKDLKTTGRTTKKFHTKYKKQIK